jgi:hypothetical protein
MADGYPAAGPVTPSRPVPATRYIGGREIEHQRSHDRDAVTQRYEGTTMGLLDKFRDAAGDLVQGAKDKVEDVTGVDADNLLEAAGSAADAGHSLSDAVGSLEDGKLSQ